MRNLIAGRVYLLQHRGLRKIRPSPTLFSHIHDPSPKPGLHPIRDKFTDRYISLKPMSHFASITPLRHLHATSSIGEETRHESDDGKPSLLFCSECAYHLFDNLSPWRLHLWGLKCMSGRMNFAASWKMV